jgi:hypothetical protein
MKSEEEMDKIVKAVMDVLREHNTSKFQTFVVLETVKLIIFVDMQKNIDGGKHGK